MEDQEVCFMQPEQYDAIPPNSTPLEALANSNIIGVIFSRADGTIVRANDEFLRIVGYSRQDLEQGALNWKSLTPPEWRDTNLQARMSVETAGAAPPFEHEYLRKDGRRAPVLIGIVQLAQPQQDAVAWVLDLSGRKRDEWQLDRWMIERMAMLNSVGNVSETKNAEAALRVSEECYRSIVENTHEGICMCDSENNKMFCNQRLVQLLGHSDALFGCPQLRFSDDAEDARRGFERRKQGCSESYEMRLRRKDGKALWANVSASPRVDENGNFAGQLCMFSDITERRRLEEQLRQSQKMEAVGRLAGGIAHDFNNLLTVILGYSGVIEGKVSKDDPIGKNIAEIRKAGERAAELTQKLLAFSRKQVQRPRVLSLNHLTRDAEPMLRRLIGENVRLSVTLDPAAGNIKADPGQIEQVLMNLCINARDAMANGGELLIATRRQNLDAGSAGLHSLSPGPYVVLEVSDTGCGMDEETKARIFEPFFTTKDPGIGTGLGLSTALGIVNQSGGAISVYSEINVGTSFKTYLPLVEDRATPSEQLKPPVCPASGETILLVEDDPGIRGLAGQVLRDRGYKVLEAASGEEALALGDALTSADLLLTDVIMTGMNGQELAARLSAAHPAVKILYMSGYTENAINQKGLLDPGWNFLPKPFGPEELLWKVGAVLSKGKGPAKLLIVDDDAQIRSFLATLLEADGYTVVQASNGREAQARCHESALDLVITDLIMPEQEGLETIHAIRHQWPDIPVIAISGAYGGAYLELAKKLGAQAVFRKPFQAHAVLGEVSRLTGRRAAC